MDSRKLKFPDLEKMSQEGGRLSALSTAEFIQKKVHLVFISV